MNRRLIRCRTQLLIDSPFFGTLALKLKLVPENTDSMATDGFHLFYSDKFVEELSDAELTGVFAHELLHCVFQHMYRRGDRNHKKWNVACDFVVNETLTTKFKFTLPKGALIDKQYFNLSAEEVYNRIPEPPEMPAWGAFLVPSTEKVDTATQEAEWTIALKQAVEAAKAAGKETGGLEELVANATAKINWREQLARLIGGVSKSDYNWLKPDPVYLHQNFIIPTLHAPSIGHLTFAIDTSASVSNNELSQFIAELRHVLEYVHFDSIRVIECDTAINKITDLDPDDTLEAKVHGRGGTSFEPVFDYIKDHPTDALVYFTDMEPYRWPKQPSIPVFWARTTKRSAPFGEYIDLWSSYES